MYNRLAEFLKDEVCSAIATEMNTQTQKSRYMSAIQYDENSCVNIHRTMVQTIDDYATDQFVSLRETVQNSVDAKATEIAIKAYTKSNGLQDVLFIDNGLGMTAEKLTSGFFSWGNKNKTEDEIGGFGLGSLAVLSGALNIIVTKSEEGTYVGIYNPNFFAKADENAYPFFVGPFDYSIKDVFKDRIIKKSLLPTGTGTVICSLDTDILKKEGIEEFLTCLEVKAVLLKKTHAGSTNYLRDFEKETSDIDDIFPHFHVEVEENNKSENFYGYMRFVNYAFIREYNQIHETNWDLDNIRTKRQARDLYHEIIANNYPIRVISERLFPQEEENEDFLFLIIGSSDVLHDAIIRGRRNYEGINGLSLRHDFRGIFLCKDGIEIERCGNKNSLPVSKEKHGIISANLIDYVYCAFEHGTAKLTRNRNAINKKKDEKYHIFFKKANSVLANVMDVHADFIQNLLLNKDFGDDMKTVRVVEEEKETARTAKNITVNSSSENIKKLFNSTNEQNNEKLTMDVFSKLSTLFVLNDSKTQLPSIIRWISKKHGSYDALVNGSNDPYLDATEAVLEFEYSLNTFKHPINSVDAIAVFTLGDINENGFKFAGKNANIVTIKGEKLLQIEGRKGALIRLYVMEDYLNNLDAYLC